MFRSSYISKQAQIAFSNESSYVDPFEGEQLEHLIQDKLRCDLTLAYPQEFNKKLKKIRNMPKRSGRHISPGLITLHKNLSRGKELESLVITKEIDRQIYTSFSQGFEESQQIIDQTPGHIFFRICRQHALLYLIYTDQIPFEAATHEELEKIKRATEETLHRLNTEYDTIIDILTARTHRYIFPIPITRIEFTGAGYGM